MSFRAKIIFFGLATLALITAIIWVLLGRRAAAPEEVPTQPEAAAPGAIPLPVTIPARPAVTVTTRAELEATQRGESIKVAAKNFTERFGSYSVLANFSNFDELRNVVTEGTWEWLNNYRQELAKQTDPNFIGVTTRVLSTKIVSQSDTEATVLLATQREETLTTGPKISYRDMLLKLTLFNNQWLVYEVNWQ